MMSEPRSRLSPEQRRAQLIAIGVAVLYGSSMLAGIFGAGDAISWQAHLFGAVGGGVAAFVVRPRRE